MKKIFSIVIILFANTVFANIPDIVAIVNDHPITKYDFETRKKLLAVLNNMDVSNPHVNHSLMAATINMLVEEELLLQHANDIGMKIKDEQIKYAINSIEHQNNMQNGAMLAHLKNKGVTIESFKKQITGELIKYNIINSLSNSITVAPSEIDVAIINTFNTDFLIQAWIFTAKEQGNDSYTKMYNLRKNVTDCDKVNPTLYEDFADAVKFDGRLKELHANTESIIHDTNVGNYSSIYQEDGKLKMVLLCKKDSNISPENLDKLKTFLSHKKMSQKATKLFKNLKNKANIKIMLTKY